MRHLLGLGLFAVAAFAVLGPIASRPPDKVEDPWAGSYLKFGEYESPRTGAFGKAPTITITREGDAYRLSKPYQSSTFREVKKGVLEDDKGGLGQIHLGSMTFSDGRKARVLRADFCYETFYLMDRPGSARRSADAGSAVEKRMPNLKVEEAEKLVRDFLFAEKPALDPGAQFPLKDITKKAVWDRLGVQVFQVTGGVQQCETFVINKKKVHRIGQGFGGRGVTSLAVADPGGDGRDKLVFAYSWGSGTHRSHVAVFDCLAKAPSQAVAPQVYFGDLGDLAVRKGKGRAVAVYAGKQKVGRLILEGKEGAWKAALRLDDGLPAAVKKGFMGVE